jgi:hypothetical protein
MALSNEKIQELIKAPVSRSQLSRAVKHEQWLRFHAEESLSRNSASTYLKDFEGEFVGKILPSDKFKFFQTMMSFPVYTNELVKSIADELSKVYDAQNSSLNYEFTNSSHEADFLKYLEESKFSEEWREKSFDAMFKAISSILVIDMPAEVKDNTEPYFYFLQIDNVIDVAVNKNGGIDYLLAHQEDDKVLFIDELRYAIFKKNEQGDHFLISESYHELGYAPACFFWKEPVNKKEPIVKRSPITSSLNNLDYLLYWETSRRCLESYAAFPIITTWKEKCNYSQTTENGIVHCTSGYLNLGKTGTIECPNCKKSKMIGPGTMFKVAPPSNKDQPNNIDGVKVVPAETESLTYCESRSSELWDEIYADCVGYGGESMDKQAMNKDQVKGNFESKKTKLLSLKENLEASHSFVVSTMARLRYGNAFVSSHINYGTKWYLQSSTEAQEEYKSAKDAGSPSYLLSFKRAQVEMVNTKGNDNDVERLNILKHLEPWVDLSIAECKNYGFDLSQPDKFLLKADFSRLVMKFEAEHGSLLEFGSLIEFKTKIDRIYNKLLDYVKADYNLNIKQPLKE